MNTVLSQTKMHSTGILFVALLVLNYNCAKETPSDNLQKLLALEVIRAKPNYNIVVSTLALRFPLCKLASFADGKAKQELLSALGMASQNMISTCYTSIENIYESMKARDLILLNKIYVNYTDDINPDFMNDTASNFGVHTEKVGFNYSKTAADFINKWIESSIFKRVTSVLSETDMDANTKMILLSAGHCRISWEKSFDIRLSKYEKFYHSNRKISNIPMMTTTGEFLYDSNHDFEILSMHLAYYGTSMTIVLPSTAQGLPHLLNLMYRDPDLIKNAKKDMRYDLMTVKIPRFKTKSFVDFTGFLKHMGLSEIFNNRSTGLNRIWKTNFDSKNMHLDKVKQKLFIEVDEMGSYRHVLGDTPITTTFSINSFTADRPFYFTVNLQEVHQYSYELFTGVYYGPE